MRPTRRGKIVYTILGIIVAAFIFYASGHIWWVGNGWCWGTGAECIGL